MKWRAYQGSDQLAPETAQGNAIPIPTSIVAQHNAAPAASFVAEAASPNTLQSEVIPTQAGVLAAQAPVVTAATATVAAPDTPEAAPEVTMITNILTWLATDSEGNYITKTSTYVNDRADIDWEPTSVTFADFATSFPESGGSGIMTDIENIPVISFPGWEAFEEIPPWTSQTLKAKETVARATSIAMNSAATSIPAEGAPEAAASSERGSDSRWRDSPYFGVPFSWLASSRGGEDSAPSFPDPPRGSQRGRVEEKHGNITGADPYALLPSAIADLLRSHSEFNLGFNDERLPSAIELELLLNLGNGQAPVAATYISNNIPSLILPSATIQIGGPAVTIQGQKLSLAPEGLIAGTRTISLQAVAPVVPTDYAAVFTLEEEKPVTFVKDAGNPLYMYNNDATLTAGGPAITSAGHTIEYNTRGAIVIDNSQTIDPSPVKKAAVAAATNRAAGGGPSGSRSGETRGNGRIVGGILIDGSAAGPDVEVLSIRLGSGNSESVVPGSNPIGSDGNGRKPYGSDSTPPIPAVKAGADAATASGSMTTKKSATAAGASSSPTASSHHGSGSRSYDAHGTGVLIAGLISFFGVLAF
jgi:hypothetical protein